MSNNLQPNSKNRDLEMLEIIERSEDGSVNQRSIASETSMALGLVNSCLRRLVRKGLIKIKDAPGRRYLYYLTPHGFAEKSRLTYEYISYSVHFYGDARKRCQQLMENKSKEGANRVGLICNSDLAEIAYLSMQEYKMEFAGIFDNQKAGEEFFGHKILSLDEAKKLDQDDLFFLYTGLEPPENSKDFAEIEMVELY